MIPPILFIIFNKREETKQVFEMIRREQPAQLFIAADGPRPEKEGEAEKCHYVRQWVLDHIDWPCEVQTFFRDENVGCGKNVSEAITWFFEQVEEGIILEDDCLANESFFHFCQLMLEKYRDNHLISAISGNNFQLQQPMDITADYYFSAFPSSWGWATWKRAWEGYCLFVSDWEDGSNSSRLDWVFKEKKYRNWWKRQFNYFYDQKPTNTWDFQFHFHVMRRKQLAVVPKANLVSNIGHGPDGTHFQDPTSSLANMPTFELAYPLKHPDAVVRNYEADVHVQKLLFGEIVQVSSFKKVKRLIKNVIGYHPTT